MLNMTIGIDIGLSTTKYMVLNEKEEVIYRKILDNATYKVEDSEKTIKKIFKQEKIKDATIMNIVATGVGSKNLADELLGVKVCKVDEIKSIGLGGVKMAGLDKGLVISMGTGTAIIDVDGKNVTHVGGSALGGGTILGLGYSLLGLDKFKDIIDASQKGRENYTDLMIDTAYTTKEERENLPEITASNLGNVINNDCTKNDIMFGSIKMVMQNLFIIAAMYAQKHNQHDIVLIGSLASVDYTQKIADEVGLLYNLNFIVPEWAAYATVFGAFDKSHLLAQSNQE